ncbi:nucleoside 2-deoxyribosyltransferase [Desulfovibrio sp. OttesenSCG-928-A18]|nr:nucleoside 2-deoxyribosyltransferase [Desulfovibrio sp. OttesenSCG-928-A18]
MRIIYQAGPLFSDAERRWHKDLTARLEREGYAVIWPGDLLSPEGIAIAGAEAITLIFNACKGALDSCSCVVALLDGPQVDDGTAWEIGYAYAKGLPVYGIRTDSRIAGDTAHNKVNSMIERCLSGLARNVEELLELLKE